MLLTFDSTIEDTVDLDLSTSVATLPALAPGRYLCQFLDIGDARAWVRLSHAASPIPAVVGVPSFPIDRQVLLAFELDIEEGRNNVISVIMAAGAEENTAGTGTLYVTRISKTPAAVGNQPPPLAPPPEG